jgi:peptidoglycan DL-endopeptidase CwlO
VNVYDPGDAIPSAARFLQAHGAPANTPAALLAFNHSSAYVSQVLATAARYTTGGAQTISAPGSALCQQQALGPLPPGTAGKVLAHAAAQLGKPYLFGATGPDAYDCSGLAMMACRAAGLSIPRTSQAQWNWGRQIPASQAQPGDLVFFAGSDPRRPRPRRHRRQPRHPHHDRRLRHRIPSRVRHLRPPHLKGRTVTRNRLHPPVVGSHRKWPFLVGTVT